MVKIHINMSAVIEVPEDTAELLSNYDDTAWSALEEEVKRKLEASSVCIHTAGKMNN